MRARAVALAVAIVLASLSARGADLVVWWEEGVYPEEDEAVREIIAAFEQDSGKQVDLVLGPQEELLADLVGNVHVWKSLLEQAGFTLEDIPGEWDPFWIF